MKTTLLILTLAITGALLAACSTTIPVNYVPSSIMRGSGQVSVGRFRYLPAERGAVAPDQFQKASAAIGVIHLSEPAAELIRTALRKELVAAGLSVSQGTSPIIEGDIQRFLYDWIGFVEVDFYLDIDFRIVRNGKVAFAYNARAHKRAPKSAAQAQDSEAIRSSISQCIDDFFLAARAQGQL